MLYGFDSPTVTFAPPRLNYGETDGDIRLRRIADVRKYCRDKLEKIQRDYTDRTNQKRKRKNISIGDIIYAKLPKQIPKQKLDYPVSGPFQVMARRGNTITIKEEETQKKYQVHPDTLIFKE